MLLYRSTIDTQHSAHTGIDAGAPTNGPTDGTSADAAGGGDFDGTSADAAGDLQLLAAKELWEFWVRCAQLKGEMVRAEPQRPPRPSWLVTRDGDDHCKLEVH